MKTVIYKINPVIIESKKNVEEKTLNISYSKEYEDIFENQIPLLKKSIKVFDSLHVRVNDVTKDYNYYDLGMKYRKNKEIIECTFYIKDYNKKPFNDDLYFDMINYISDYDNLSKKINGLNQNYYSIFTHFKTSSKQKETENLENTDVIFTKETYPWFFKKLCVLYSKLKNMNDKKEMTALLQRFSKVGIN